MRFFKTLLVCTVGLATLTPLALAEAPSTNPAQDILGVWTTGFMTDPQGMVQYRVTYNFNDNGQCRFNIDVSIHHPLGDSASRDSMVCDYRIGGPAPQLAGAYNFDLNIHTFFTTALHPSTVREYNEKRECGLTNWQLGVPRDVTGLTCDGEDKTVTGWQYDIVVVKKDDSIQFGLVPEGDETTGTAPDNRPTALDPESKIPRNGQGGIFNPGGSDDRLPGFYRVTSYKKNPRGCDLAGATATTSRYSHFELYPNNEVVPLMVGWSTQTCQSVEACRQAANTFNLSGEFFIHEPISADQFKGEATSTNWTTVCNATVQLTQTQRADNGALAIVSRTYKGVVAGITTDEECKPRSPLIDQQMQNFACTDVLEVKADYLGR